MEKSTFNNKKMSNTKVANQQIESFKERFEIKFYVNDNVFCQRYFKINDLNEKTLHSNELVSIITECMSYIQNDMMSKTRVFLHQTAPLIFKSKNELENWLTNPNNTYNLQMCTEFIISNKREPDYYWDGKTIQPHKEKSKENELTLPIEDNNIVYKLSFIDNEKEVISRIWENPQEPKYIRNILNLYNGKSRYDNNSSQSEVSLYSRINDNRDNIIYKIINTLSSFCSSYTFDEDGGEVITTEIKIGNKTYSLTPKIDLINKLERIYKKKTELYMNSLK